MKGKLDAAATAGIACLLLIPARLVIDFFAPANFPSGHPLALVVSFVFSMLSASAFLVYVYGYLVLGRLHRKTLLFVASYVLAGAEIVEVIGLAIVPAVNVYSWLSFAFSIGTPLSIVEGASLILSGVGIMTFKAELGYLAVWVGVVEICYGGIGVLFLSAKAEDLIGIPLFILGSLLLSRAGASTAAVAQGAVTYGSYGV
jgi:hypothetical protein